MQETKNLECLFSSNPSGSVSGEQFSIQETGMPEVGEGQLLLKLAYVSVDPYMRGRMNQVKNYFEVFQVGKPLDGGVICEVVESKNPKFKKNQFVISFLPWVLYQVNDGSKIQVLPEGIPPSYFLGALGMPGISGFLPLFKIGMVDKGQTIFISSAAGAVGTVAGQVCKSLGMKVIGSTSSKEKAEYLKELGFDHVINYTTENIDHKLKEFAPEGLDVYFDNVGGETLDVAIYHMKMFGRIIVCGQIASYDVQKPYAFKNFFMVVTKSLKIEGFISTNWMPEWQKAEADLLKLYKDGKLKIRETVIEGFENIPKAFMGLFKSENVGKMIVKI